MPFEETFYRERLERRSRLSRMTTEVPEERFPVQQRGSEDLGVRENARFDDQTGYSLIGFSVIGTFTT